MTAPSKLADLHRHLDGSLRRETLVALASEAGVEVDPNLKFAPGMGLAAALACFEATLSVLKEPQAVRRVAAEMCEDALLNNVTTLEIRFAPQLHVGAAPEAIVEAALEGIGGRAGLILCGLYGEPPSVLEGLVDIGIKHKGVVAVDLAGGPAPGHDFGMDSYSQAFTRARDAGLGRTVHAGEGRPPSEIRVAIESLHAQRIGHGTTILDDPSVVELALKRGVTIEACVTSNVHTGIIGKAAEHPIPLWLERGLSVCVCTDNTLLSDVDAPEEFRRVAAVPGMTPLRMAEVLRAGHRAAFRRE